MFGRKAVAEKVTTQRPPLQLANLALRPSNDLPLPGNDTQAALGGIEPAKTGDAKPSAISDKLQDAVRAVQPIVLERIDSEAASRLERDELGRQLAAILSDITGELKIQLNQREQRDVVALVLDDRLGLGPLEPLLAEVLEDDVERLLGAGASDPEDVGERDLEPLLAGEVDAD